MSSYQERLNLYKGTIASDYYFYWDESQYEDSVIFWIGLKKYQETYLCLDDQHILKFVKSFLPVGFSEVQESGFEYSLGSTQEGAQALEAIGLQQQPPIKHCWKTEELE